MILLAKLRSNNTCNAMQWPIAQNFIIAASLADNDEIIILAHCFHQTCRIHTYYNYCCFISYFFKQKSPKVWPNEAGK